MNRKFALLKTVVALSATLLAVSPWAAEENPSTVYCVKKVGYDGEYYAQLSQQKASYVPDEDEICGASWATLSGQDEPAMVEILNSLLQDEDVSAKGILLASDIDFGGYDESSQKCNRQYRPIMFYEQNGSPVIRSKGNKAYTVRGLCYITEYYDEFAVFAQMWGYGSLTLENIIFEDLHLENEYTAGLLINTRNVGSGIGSGEGSYKVSDVSVKDAVVKTSYYGGLIAALAMNADVINFQGENISVSTKVQAEPNKSSNVAIGGFFGKVDSLATMERVSIKNLSVIQNWEQESSNGQDNLGNPLVVIGGLVGYTTGAILSNVGVDSLTVADQTESGGCTVGGLVGFAYPLESRYQYTATYPFQVTNTFTVGDIRCGGTNSCEIGFGLGRMRIDSNPEYYDGYFYFFANYHYSDNSDDAAGFLGRLKSYSLADSDVGTKEFNNEGVLDFYASGETESMTAVANGNFRNAVGGLVASELDTGYYVVYVEEPTNGEFLEYPNGIIDGSVMKSPKFAEAMNYYGRRYFSENSGYTWQYGDRLATPYIEGMPGYAREEQSSTNEIWITFSMDCVNFGCLTQDEEAMLRGYENYRLYNINGVVFRMDAYEGRINEKWAEFASELTQENSDREALCWVPARGKMPFSVDNVYTQDMSYTLSTACDADTVKTAQMFLGEGVNYYESPVTIMTFSKDSTGALTEVSNMTSDGNSAMSFKIGDVIYIYSSTPMTTDGSKFKGWKLRAALSLTSDEDVLLERAKVGIPVPMDENGYFDLGLVYPDLKDEFRQTPEGQKWFDGGEEEEAVVAVIIYPEGFEAVNGIEESGDSGNDEPWEDEPGKEYPDIEKPLLLQSGNAIQLVVRTEHFEYRKDEPFIALVIENDDGQDIVNDSIRNEFGWPEDWRWTHYPLATGNYLLTADIFDGLKTLHFEQTFEVKSEIAEGKADSWQMVSLWNVDFDSYKWTDDGIFYWWDESSVVGKFWQYQELSRKDSPEQGRGYWYSSRRGKSLKLNDSVFTEDMSWKLDSVNSGWNLVSNPYGWYLELGVADMEEEEEYSNEGNSCEEQREWLESEAHREGKFDKEFYEHEKSRIDELCRSLLPAVEFWRWY